MKKHRGFTLLELLIVVAIIGLLAAVVIFFISDANKKGNDAERVSEMKQIQNALELYFADNNSYPQTIYGPPSPLVEGGHISEMPLDPQGEQYMYAALQNCRQYHLAVGLEKENNDVLGSDADLSGYTQANVCGSGTTINGDDPVYDLVQ